MSTQPRVLHYILPEAGDEEEDEAEEEEANFNLVNGSRDSEGKHCDTEGGICDYDGKHYDTLGHSGDTEGGICDGEGKLDGDAHGDSAAAAIPGTLGNDDHDDMDGKRFDTEGGTCDSDGKHYGTLGDPGDIEGGTCDNDGKHYDTPGDSGDIECGICSSEGRHHDDDDTLGDSSTTVPDTLDKDLRDCEGRRNGLDSGFCDSVGKHYDDDDNMGDSGIGNKENKHYDDTPGEARKSVTTVYAGTGRRWRQKLADTKYNDVAKLQWSPFGRAPCGSSYPEAKHFDTDFTGRAPCGSTYPEAEHFDTDCTGGRTLSATLQKAVDNYEKVDDDDDDRLNIEGHGRPLDLNLNGGKGYSRRHDQNGGKGYTKGKSLSKGKGKNTFTGPEEERLIGQIGMFLRAYGPTQLKVLAATNDFAKSYNWIVRQSEVRINDGGFSRWLQSHGFLPKHQRKFQPTTLVAWTTDDGDDKGKGKATDKGKGKALPIADFNDMGKGKPADKGKGKGRQGVGPKPRAG